MHSYNQMARRDGPQTKVKNATDGILMKLFTHLLTHYSHMNYL